MSVSSSDDGNDSDFGSEEGYDEDLAAIDYEADLSIEKNIDTADDIAIMVILFRSIIRINYIILSFYYKKNIIKIKYNKYNKYYGKLLTTES